MHVKLRLLLSIAAAMLASSFPLSAPSAMAEQPTASFPPEFVAQLDGCQGDLRRH